MSPFARSRFAYARPDEARAGARASRTPRATVLWAALMLVPLLMLAPRALAASPAPPSVTTSYASGATYSSVTLHGYVNPHGVATGYAFQYGTSAAYGGQTALTPAGNGTITIKLSQPVTGLQAGTVYHYRMVAVNGAGLTYGKDRTFKTASIPLSLQIAGQPNPVIYGEPFVVEGTLTGTGSANREVQLQSNPYPYTAGFQVVGNPELTSSTGAFSFPYLGLLTNAQLRVVTVGGTIISSPVITENVAVKVTFHSARTRKRGFVRLYGTVTPAEVGARVGFQLLQPGNSLNQGGAGVVAETPTTSKFSRTVRVKRAGVYRALVVIDDPAHVYAYSPPIYVR